MTYYYALWILVLKKGIPAILRQTLPEKELKDLPEHNALIIKGTIDNSYDIRIAYRLSGENKEKTLLFRSERRGNEGFMIYSLELSDSEEDFFCKSLSCGMHSAVYHYIKGFFHKHRFHFDSEDSLLPAYFSCEKINWKSTDTQRNIMQTLIRYYSLKFTGYLNDWENGFYKAFEEIPKNKHITRNIYIFRDTLQISRNIFGEMEYCKFLMSSFPTLVPRKSKSEIQNTLSELGSHIILGDLTSQAYNFMTLNRKNFISSTPLKVALNAFNLALNASADALVSLSLKKFKILS